MRVHRVVLEQQPNVSLSSRDAGHVVSVNRNRTASGFQQPRDAVQQRALPATAWPEHNAVLARDQCQIKVVDDPGGPSVDGQSVDLKRMRGHPLAS